MQTATIEAPSEQIAKDTPVLLIVDDDSLTLEMLSLSLADANFKVYTAESISEALKIASRNHISLVVTDIGLPDGSGIDLINRLTEYNVFKAIALTGYSPDRKMREAGFHACLTKPIDIDYLLRAIDAAIEP